jgi:chromosome segregation ATPase
VLAHVHRWEEVLLPLTSLGDFPASNKEPCKMVDNSFSLQFTPLQRIKTVKDYETEIDHLKNENFELKHQLSHYKTLKSAGVNEDMQRLLLDSKRSIDILENEKDALNKQIEILRNAAQKLSEEKDEVETRMAHNLQECLGKIALLEEENGRLIKHVENINEMSLKLRSDSERYNECMRTIEDQKAYIERILDEKKGLGEKEEQLRNERTAAEKELANYKNSVLNLSREREQLVYEREREKNEYGSKIGQLQSLVARYESRLGESEAELGRLREYCRSTQQHQQSNDMHVKELRDNYTRETREKQDLALKNEELRREVERLGEMMGDLERKKSVIENEKRALAYRVSLSSEDANTIGILRGELEKVHRAREELSKEMSSNKEECSKHMEELSRLRAHEGSMRSRLQEKEREFETRMDELENMANKVSAVADRIRGQHGQPSDEINGLIHKLNKYKRVTEIKSENREFLRKFDITAPIPLDEIIERFKDSYNRACDRLRVLEKEVAEMAGSAGNSKDARTVKLLEDFSREFDVARRDLDACRRYLVRKNEENKELKADKLRLEKKFNESRNNEERIRSAYASILDKLKMKDDVISRLEMRAGSKAM